MRGEEGPQNVWDATGEGQENIWMGQGQNGFVLIIFSTWIS